MPQSTAAVAVYQQNDVETAIYMRRQVLVPSRVLVGGINIYIDVCCVFVGRYVKSVQYAYAPAWADTQTFSCAHIRQEYLKAQWIQI